MALETEIDEPIVSPESTLDVDNLDLGIDSEPPQPSNHVEESILITALEEKHKNYIEQQTINTNNLKHFYIEREKLNSKITEGLTIRNNLDGALTVTSELIKIYQNN